VSFFVNALDLSQTETAAAANETSGNARYYNSPKGERPSAIVSPYDRRSDVRVVHQAARFVFMNGRDVRAGAGSGSCTRAGLAEKAGLFGC
jgi:hypothetical protein